MAQTLTQALAEGSGATDGSTVADGSAVADGPIEDVADGALVLDGGLATELEARGHDLSGRLWSARLLREDPEEIVAVHRAYAAAGARALTTATYQASTAGLVAAGLAPSEATALIVASVRLARRAAQEAEAAQETEAAPEAEAAHGRGRPIWVAGSVGPYGAMLAGGQEYTGEYAGPGGLGVGELRAFHRPRMATLAEAGADVLACETVPCLAEAEALVAELADLDVPGWLALTTVTGPDGTVLTRRGEPAAAAFALARGVRQVVAVGVNCTDPAGVPAAVACARTASGGRPVVVYPNSGETWDAARRRWAGRRAPVWGGDVAAAAAVVRAWRAAGARLIGGCCRVGPAQITALAAAVGARPALNATRQNSSGGA